MKTLYSFLLLLIILFANCEKDEPSPLVSCPEGAVFAVDFRGAQFSVYQLWLTDQAKQVGLDEEYGSAAGGLQYVSLEGACSETYTLSTVAYRSGYITGYFEVQEFAGIQNGYIVDYWNAQSISSAFWGGIPAGTITITACPPIDSVRLITPLDPRNEYPEGPRFSYEYNAADSTLAVHTLDTYIEATDLLLAVRATDSGLWVGLPINANVLEPLPIPLAYTSLEPLPLRTATVSWPDDAENAKLEIRWINSVSGRRSMPLLADGQTEEIAFPCLSDALGPFLLEASWNDGQERFIRRVLSDWPEAIDIRSAIEGEVLSMNYPQFQYEAQGADIAQLSGRFGEAGDMEFCRRYYTEPAQDGSATVSFAPISPSLSQKSNQLVDLYINGFDTETILNLYHYPNMNDDYSWYFRYVLGDYGSGQLWLQSLEYEQLTIPF